MGGECPDRTRRRVWYSPFTEPVSVILRRVGLFDYSSGVVFCKRMLLGLYLICQVSRTELISVLTSPEMKRASTRGRNASGTVVL